MLVPLHVFFLPAHEDIRTGSIMSRELTHGVAPVPGSVGCQRIVKPLLLPSVIRCDEQCQFRRGLVESWSRSMARAFSMSRVRVSAFFALSIACTCSRLRL